MHGCVSEKFIKPWSGLDLAMGYSLQTSDIKKTVPPLHTFWVDTDTAIQCIGWSFPAGPRPVCVLKVLGTPVLTATLSLKLLVFRDTAEMRRGRRAQGKFKCHRV